MCTVISGNGDVGGLQNYLGHEALKWTVSAIASLILKSSSEPPPDVFSHHKHFLAYFIHANIKSTYLLLHLHARVN